jgi:hypothetical protein
MINKDKKRIMFTFYNINKNEKTKIFLNKLIDKKSLKRLNKDLPNNFTCFSNNPSHLSSINIKNRNNKIKESITLKTNQSISTISSMINKNNHNDYKNFYTYDYSNKINDLNISTIHSNGKFQNTKKIKINLRDKIFSQSDKIILKNKFISKKLKKNLSIQVKEKNFLKDNLKDIKISSHYLGNILDNKFGIMTNKFSVNKNILLTSSHSSLRLKKNYNNSIQLEINDRNRNQINEFKTINIQDHNNYFNDIGTIKYFPEIKTPINSEKIYINLMNKMTEAFNSKLKEYLIYKLKEKNKSKSPNLILENFRKNFKQFKKEKSSSNKCTINFIYKAPMYERNNSFLLNNESKNKTLGEHINKNIYRVIAIKNSRSHNRFINIKSNENKTSELP